MKLNLFGRLMGAVGLVAVLPVLAGCALAIYVEDGRPILFRQRRIGAAGKPFLILKLRTMRDSKSGRSITTHNDSRITVVGRILRDLKIDELPQLWNVVRGDMAFIGPRPEVPEYVDLSDPQWQAVLRFRPGITDLSSLLFRNEERMLSTHENVEEFYRKQLLPYKLEVSRRYSANRSLLKDARLLALTAKHLVLRTDIDAHEFAEQFFCGGISTWRR